MSEDIEQLLANLFRKAIDDFPSEFRELAKEWLTMRQKALNDMKELAARFRYI